MRIVIIGAGMVGQRIAKALLAEDRDVVLIEKDAETARIALNELDSMVIHADGFSAEALDAAGLSEAELFVALTGSDEANIVACGLAAARFPSVRRLALVSNPYYLELPSGSKATMGVDELINPDVETADRIVHAISEGIERGLVLLPGQLRMRPVQVGKDSPLAGKSLPELRRGAERPFLIPALVRRGDFLIPSGRDSLLPGDLAYVLAEESAFELLLGAHKQERIRRIVLVGGTRTAEFVIERLAGSERRLGIFGRLARGFSRERPPELTLIERDGLRAKELARSYPELLVQNLTVSADSEEVESLLGGADLVATLTDSQSLNLMTAFRAKRLGAGKTIALVQTESYRKLAPALEVDAVMSLEESVVNTVLAEARRARIRTLHSFSEAEADIIELHVAADSTAAGKRLRELERLREALVLYVLRAEEAIIPDGETRIAAGDRLCLIARRSMLAKLERYFGGGNGD